MWDRRVTDLHKPRPSAPAAVCYDLLAAMFPAVTNFLAYSYDDTFIIFISKFILKKKI